MNSIEQLADQTTRTSLLNEIADCEDRAQECRAAGIDDTYYEDHASMLRREFCQKYSARTIKATCEQLDPKTEKALPGTVRLIGHYDTVDEASSAGAAARKDNEAVCVYNAPAEVEEYLSALEMAEMGYDLNAIASL